MIWFNLFFTDEEISQPRTVEQPQSEIFWCCFPLPALFLWGFLFLKSSDASLTTPLYLSSPPQPHLLALITCSDPLGGRPIGRKDVPLTHRISTLSHCRVSWSKSCKGWCPSRAQPQLSGWKKQTSSCGCSCVCSGVSCARRKPSDLPQERMAQTNKCVSEMPVYLPLKGWL